MVIEEFVKRIKKRLETTDEAINRRLTSKSRPFQLVAGYICELLKKDATIPIKIPEIRDAWGIAVSTVIYHINFLEAQGLIKKEAGMTGYIHYHAVLNDKGKPKILKYDKRIKEALGDVGGL